MAATTITRTTWTDDDGTGTVGSIVDNAELQLIYDKIDALFSSFGSHTFEAAGTGANTLVIRNTTAGAGNMSAFDFGNDLSAQIATIRAYSSTFTSSGPEVQASLAMRGLGAGGISIAAESGTGAIRFYSGGVTERARFDSNGAFVIAGEVTHSGAVNDAGIISPAQLVATTHDWDPTGMSTARVIRVSTDASRDLTGLAAQSSGARILLLNIGAQNLVIKHDTTSTATNRFYCPGSVDFTLNANDAVEIWYDATSGRWRVVAA